MNFGGSINSPEPEHPRTSAQMPCGCAQGKCTTCACAKAQTPCTEACHGGGKNSCCINFAEAIQTKQMKVGVVRKTLAAAGLDVMGTKVGNGPCCPPFPRRCYLPLFTPALPPSYFSSCPLLAPANEGRCSPVASEQRCRRTSW